MSASFILGRRRVKFRFLVFIALLIAGTYYFYTINKPAFAYATLSYGQVEINDSGPAIIIRDESIYAAPAYGKGVYSAADGDMVAIDQPIALLYKESFDEDTIYQLYSIQEKIIQYQQNQLIDQVLDNDMIKLNSDMDSIIFDIQSLIRDDLYKSISQKENQLRKLLLQKQKILDRQTVPDAYLTQLYDSESTLLRKIKDWTIDIVAPQSGLISFSLDGYENILDHNAVDKLNPDDFRLLLSQSPKVEESDTTKAEQPFFRIVDPHKNWYVVFEADGKEVYYNRGDTLNILFDNGAEQQGKVYKILREKSSSIIILELSSGVDKVINKRITPIHIAKTVDGLIVPYNALVKHRGKTGVYVKDREEHIFIEASVKAAANGYAVIETTSDNVVLKLHDQVRIKN